MLQKPFKAKIKKYKIFFFSDGNPGPKRRSKDLTKKKFKIFSKVVSARYYHRYYKRGLPGYNQKSNDLKKCKTPKNAI